MAKEIDITQRNNITIGDIKENSADTPKLSDDNFSINGGRKGTEIDSSFTNNERLGEEIKFYESESFNKNVSYQSGDDDKSPSLSGGRRSVEINTYNTDANKVRSEAVTNDPLAFEGNKQVYKELETEIGPGIERLRGKINRDYKDNIFSDVFLINVFPIIGTSLYKNIESMAQGDWNSVTGIMSTLHTVMNLVMQVKYLTPVEMIMFLGSNFYTLHFIRGITAKKFTGFFGSSWDGYPDLTFGRNYIDLLPSISEILSSIADIVRPPELPYPKGDNAAISDVKERIGPTLEITSPYEKITLNKQLPGTDPLTPGNKRLPFNQDPVGFPSKRILEKDKEAGKWKNGTGNEKDDFSAIEKDEISRKLHSKDEESYFVNDKVINILLPREEGNKPYPSSQRDTSAIEGGINDLKNYRPDDESIGYILVIPQTQETDKFPRYRIPFEFNPEISPGGITTNYNAQEILARIGSLQTFSNVQLSTVDITAEYFATADNLGESKESGSRGNEWMSKYTLKLLQGIQKGFEALSYPFFPSNEEQNIEKGFKYMKPPLVKVIIGEANADEETPYSNILTYPKNVVDSNDILSSTTEKRLYKTFIVTSVNIEKDLKETPLYIENKKLKDTFGFSVSLSLTEVTKNYMDVMPNYENYFKQFNNMIDDSRVIVD